MANYWIKLYHELLDDPKTATLPDRLWRRFIECCLMAGRLGGTGRLPDTTQLAWVLRMDTDELALDLDQLTVTGMIERTAGGWMVVNFAKRQAAVGDAERKAQERKRDQTGQYYSHEDVTNPSRNVTQINRLTDTDTELELDTESDAKFKKLQSILETKTGCMMTPLDIPAVDEMVKAGATEADVIAAVAWYKDQGKVITQINRMVPSVRFAISKRTQAKVQKPTAKSRLEELAEIV